MNSAADVVAKSGDSNPPSKKFLIPRFRQLRLIERKLPILVYQLEVPSWNCLINFE